MGSRTGIAASEAQGPPPRGIVRDYAETLLVCVIVFLFLRTFVVQPSEIPSGSMEDGLLPGDYIVVNRWIHAPTSFDWERRLLPIGSVDRGQVVVFRHPQEPERDFIKRVIGLPGDIVELRGGHVFVNGGRLEEPWVNPLYRSPDFFPATRVPEGEYFMLGDHRNNSSDSRRWGTVGESLLKGRAVAIVFSTAPPYGEGDVPGQVTLLSVARKIWNLAFHARWARALRPIR